MSKGSSHFEVGGVARKCLTFLFLCKFFMFVFVLVCQCFEVKTNGLIKAHCGTNEELLKFSINIYKN